jgi:hypothetical protein
VTLSPTWIFTAPNATVKIGWSRGLVTAEQREHWRRDRASRQGYRRAVGLAGAWTLALIAVSGGNAMGAFSSLVLFSEVKGTVLKDGQPVAGAEIVQQVDWSDDPDKNPRNQTTTDKNGAFSFPAVERSAGLLRLVPAQPMILQKLIIRYQGVEYEGWLHGKDSYDANTELDGRPLRLVCDLATAPDYEGTHFGICRAV